MPDKKPLVLHPFILAIYPILLKQPNIPEVHKSLGLIYSQKKKNPDKAIHHFQEYLRLSPSQSDASQIKSMIQALNTPN